MNEEIGILDPEGKNINPLTNKEYSDEYKKLSKIWSKFPAYEKRDEIIKNIEKSQVNIIVSGTGSGKTVLLPKFLLHVLKYEKKIAVTLPKQIIAQSAAEFSAKTLDVELGKQVGYKFRGSSSNMYSNQTKILYATDGTIVSMLMNDEYLKEFDGVIIDEAHERKVQIDFLLYLLRRTVSLRKDFKLIIMSATINSNIFIDYFRDYNPLFIDVGSKTNYSIKSIYLENKDNIEYKEIIKHGIEILKKLLTTTKTGDILFFINSSNEAKDICKEISNFSDSYCIEVYSGMNNTKQEYAQDIDKYKELNASYQRKIVIATNVAESSLTIDGIEYVIDSGFELSSGFNPQFRAKILNRQRISHAQIKQRMGRAGRTKEGTCYHLYSKDILSKIPQYPLPSIRKEDITNELLKILAYPHVKTYTKLLEIISNLIEPPLENYINYSGLRLLECGALNKEHDMNITPLGEFMSKINLDINHVISLIIAKNLNCSFEVLKIISMLDASKNNINEIFSDPTLILSNKQNEPNYKNMIQNLNNKFDDAKSKFKNKYGDHISLLKIFEKYYDAKDKNDFVYKYFIRKDTLDKALKFYEKNKKYLFTDIKKIKIQIPSQIINADIYDKIIYSIANGLYDKKASVNKNKSTLSFGPEKWNFSQSSFIHYITFSNSVLMYEELFIMMDKPEINIVTKLPNIVIDNLTNIPSLLKYQFDE
jgi:HrpA-like RNA helicase